MQAERKAGTSLAFFTPKVVIGGSWLGTGADSSGQKYTVEVFHVAIL